MSDFILTDSHIEKSGQLGRDRAKSEKESGHAVPQDDIYIFDSWMIEQLEPNDIVEQVTGYKFHEVGLHDGSEILEAYENAYYDWWDENE